MVARKSNFHSKNFVDGLPSAWLKFYSALGAALILNDALSCGF